MGFGSKIKGFFGRVWNGAKSGYSKAKRFIREKITPVVEKITPILKMIPQTSAAANVVDKVVPQINNLSDDLSTGIKQGVKIGMDRLKDAGIMK